MSASKCIFSLKLLRKSHAQQIDSLHLDGYLMGASVLVLNGERSPETHLDEKMLAHVHHTLGALLGTECFLLIPEKNVDFEEKFVDLDGVRYHILRLSFPSSMLGSTPGQRP